MGRLQPWKDKRVMVTEQVMALLGGSICLGIKEVARTEYKAFFRCCPALIHVKIRAADCLL